jgi:hypothetical protein
VSLALAAAGRLLDFAEAEVVWSRPNGRRSGFGVRFTNLRPRAAALVDHLVARGGTGTPLRRLRGAHFIVAGLVFATVATGAFFGLRAGLSRAEPAPVMSVAPRAPAPPAPDPTTQTFPGEFQFVLPTGGVSALRVTVKDEEVAVIPTLRKGAVIKKVFTLPSPARLIIDVGGREPRYSWQLEGTTVVKSVRIGARNHGTRVVVDLPEQNGKSYRVVTPPSTGV